MSNYFGVDSSWVDMGDDDRCALTIILTNLDFNMCYDCLENLVEGGETLDPVDRVKSLLK
jgi:hypothetical protein